ncbi:MAG: DUF3006 domain-containing protein, partial [Defluviitaleaceae bacterium]|nr:DUF3006 domain-containing protein [Defluviitaleaceae bacterium]
FCRKTRSKNRRVLAARKVFCDEVLRQKDRKHSAVFSLNNYMGNDGNGDGRSSLGSVFMGNDDRLSYVSRVAPKWVLDRIEDGAWAVLENSETREVISLPLVSLPKGVRAGSTLVRTDGKWYVNEAESAARQGRIRERLGRIRQNSKEN